MRVYDKTPPVLNKYTYMAAAIRANNASPVMKDIIYEKVQLAIDKAMGHKQMLNHNKMIYKLVEHVKLELIKILMQIKENDYTNITLSDITTVEPENIKQLVNYIPDNISNIIDIEYCNEEYKLITGKFDTVYYVKFLVLSPNDLKTTTQLSGKKNANNYITLLSNIIVYLYFKKNVVYRDRDINNNIIDLIPFGIYSSYKNIVTKMAGNNDSGYRMIEEKLETNLYNYGLPINALVKNNTNISQSFCIYSFSNLIKSNTFNYNIDNEQFDTNTARLFVTDNIERNGGIYIKTQEKQVIYLKDWQSKLDELNTDGTDTQSKIKKLKSDGSTDNIYKIIGDVLFTNITNLQQKIQYSKMVTHLCSQNLFVVYLKLLLNSIYELYLPYPLDYSAKEQNNIYILYDSTLNILVVKRTFDLKHYTDMGMINTATNDMIVIYNFETDQLFITMDIQNSDFADKLNMI